MKVELIQCPQLFHMGWPHWHLDKVFTYNRTKASWEGKASALGFMASIPSPVTCLLNAGSKLLWDGSQALQIYSFETGRNSWNVSKTAELVGILLRTSFRNLSMKAVNLERKWLEKKKQFQANDHLVSQYKCHFKEQGRGGLGYL